MKKQHKRLLLTKENIRVLSGSRMVHVAGGTIEVSGLDTGGGDTAPDPDPRAPTGVVFCPDAGSASKAPTGAC